MVRELESVVGDLSGVTREGIVQVHTGGSDPIASIPHREGAWSKNYSTHGRRFFRPKVPVPTLPTKGARAHR